MGAEPAVAATVVDVSQHGARLVSPVSARPRDVVSLQHERTGRWARARVVRASTETPEGLYELGVAFLDDTSGRFWRDVYADPRD